MQTSRQADESRRYAAESMQRAITKAKRPRVRRVRRVAACMGDWDGTRPLWNPIFLVSSLKILLPSSSSSHVNPNPFICCPRSPPPLLSLSLLSLALFLSQHYKHHSQVTPRPTRRRAVLSKNQHIAPPLCNYPPTLDSRARTPDPSASHRKAT